MVMVPVLVVMSGALAFSAFTGSITTNVNASAGYISFNQQAWLYNYSAKNTVMTVDGMSLAIPSSTMSFQPMSLGWAGLDSSITNTTSQTVSVANMAPGNFVTFEFKVTNNGSVGFVLSAASPRATVTPGSEYQGQSLSSSQASSWSDFNSDMTSGTGYIYMVTSIPSGSIDAGTSASYFVVVGLASATGNTYQQSSFALTISVTVTSDA